MSEKSDWTEQDDALERVFELPSFAEAMSFANSIAAIAERENHHPDLTISYRRVTVRWTTHSAGGVTDRDRALAAETDTLLP